MEKNPPKTYIYVEVNQLQHIEKEKEKRMLHVLFTLSKFSEIIDKILKYPKFTKSYSNI